MVSEQHRLVHRPEPLADVDRLMQRGRQWLEIQGHRRTGYASTLGALPWGCFSEDSQPRQLRLQPARRLNRKKQR